LNGKDGTVRLTLARAARKQSVIPSVQSVARRVGRPGTLNLLLPVLP